MMKSALLICDMLNTFDFPEAQQLHPPALRAAKAIARLKKRCRRKKLPIIYVNDNFGKWKSDWRAIYEECRKPECLGQDLAQILKPETEDYFILKPKHSGFFQTTLELLLKDLKIRRIILTGVAGNICVLFTANDAHMRNYEVVVPKDCIASNTKKDTEFTLRQLSLLGIRSPGNYAP